MHAPSRFSLSRRHSVLFAAAAVGGLSLSLPAFGQVFLTSADTSVVAFDQINEGNTGTNAAEGEVTLDVSAALGKLGNPSGGGFLNVADSSGNWLVQNLPVFPSGSLYNSPSVTSRYVLSNDTDGTNDTSEPLVAELTTTTLDSHPTGATASFSVGNMDFEGGGGGDTGDLTGYEPEANVTIQGNLTFNPGQSIPVLAHYQTQHPNIQAANNQCALAATANSLDYLRISKGLTILNNPANTTGLRPDNTLVGKLENATNMDRQNVTTRLNGSGVWPLDGLLKFAATDTAIQTYYAVSRTATFTSRSGNGGVTLNGTTNRTVGTQTSIAIGSTINFNLIDGLLANGLAVLMDEAWGVNGANGRHYVQVLGDGKIDNKPFIIFSSDLLQTPSDTSDLRLGNYFPNSTNAGLDSGIEFDWLGGTNGDLLVNHNSVIDQLIAINVPEPGMIGMLVLGAGMFVARRRRVAG